MSLISCSAEEAGQSEGEVIDLSASVSSLEEVGWSLFSQKSPFPEKQELIEADC